MIRVVFVRVLVPAMLNQSLLGSSRRRPQNRVQRLMQGVSHSLRSLRSRGSKASLLRKLFTLCAQDRPKVLFSFVFLFLEIGCYITLQYFCEQQMDIASAISQPTFSCNGGRPFSVPMWNNSVGSGVPLTLSCPQPEIQGTDCPFDQLMSMPVAYTFCSYNSIPPHSSCVSKHTPDCSSPCSIGSCYSCERSEMRKIPVPVCESLHPSKLVHFDDFFACQKQYKQYSRYLNRLGSNCSATVQVPASPAGINFTQSSCYYGSPQVIVQCADSGASATGLTSDILTNFLLMLALGIGEVICKTIYTWLLRIVGTNLTGRLRVMVLQQIMSKSIKFHDKNAPAEMASYINSAQEVDEFVVVTFSLFKNAAQILGCLLYILFGLQGDKVSSPLGGSFTHLSKLVSIAAATIAVISVFTLPYRKLVSKYTRNSIDWQAELSDLTISISSHIRSVRSLQIEIPSLSTYTAACLELMRNGVRLTLTGAAYTLLLGLCTAGSFAYIVYLAALDVSNGILTQTELIIFFLVIDIVFESLDSFFECTEQMFEMEEACNVLLEFIYEDDKVAEVVSDDSVKSGHLLGVVTENISMTEAPKPVYESRHSACHLTFRNVALICDDLTVFSRLSFDLKPGQRAFILCATSQQKVSVLDTLSFLAPHSTGTVLIDDNVVSIDSDGHNIRREVALCIPQNFTISGMSVEKNILQFSASPPSLKELCARAGIDSDLGDLSMFGDSLMPDGIPPCMSLIAQLLRLFVNPSRMVVVDAAVLSRSNSYHRAIPKIISSLSEGKTTIVVADMLLPVSSAFYQSFESIHVLDATGACVEFGTHDELLRLTHFRARLQEISDWRDDMNGLFTASAQRK